MTRNQIQKGLIGDKAPESEADHVLLPLDGVLEHEALHVVAPVDPDRGERHGVDLGLPEDPTAVARSLVLGRRAREFGSLSRSPSLTMAPPLGTPARRRETGLVGTHHIAFERHVK